jgi:hypothetical protein
MAVLSNILKTAGKTAGKAVKTTGSAAYHATMATGKVSSGIVDAVGSGSIKAGKAIAGGSKKATSGLLRDATEQELKDAGFAGSLVKKRLTKRGLVALGAGTMAVSTAGAVGNNGSKFNRMGNISTAENLDRLVSYDGSGFLNNINRVTQGDPEVMQDVVDNSFDNLNQFGASGDLVFALHNMREG